MGNKVNVIFTATDAGVHKKLTDHSFPEGENWFVSAHNKDWTELMRGAFAMAEGLEGPAVVVTVSKRKEPWTIAIPEPVSAYGEIHFRFYNAVTKAYPHAEIYKNLEHAPIFKIGTILMEGSTTGMCEVHESIIFEEVKFKRFSYMARKFFDTVIPADEVIIPTPPVVIDDPDVVVDEDEDLKRLLTLAVEKAQVKFGSVNANYRVIDRSKYALVDIHIAEVSNALRVVMGTSAHIALYWPYWNRYFTSLGLEIIHSGDSSVPPATLEDMGAIMIKLYALAHNFYPVPSSSIGAKWRIHSDFVNGVTPDVYAPYHTKAWEGLKYHYLPKIDRPATVNYILGGGR